MKSYLLIGLVKIRDDTITENSKNLGLHIGPHFLPFLMQTRTREPIQKEGIGSSPWWEILCNYSFLIILERDLQGRREIISQKIVLKLATLNSSTTNSHISSNCENLED